MDTTINYMPVEASKEEVKAADKICNDDKIYSDDSGLSNKQKWEYVQEIFNVHGKCNLFSPISFETLYQDDEHVRCGAAQYVADLRTQYLRYRLCKDPSDLALHALYVHNRQWWAKLRERVNLEKITGALHGAKLL